LTITLPAALVQIAKMLQTAREQHGLDVELKVLWNASQIYWTHSVAHKTIQCLESVIEKLEPYANGCKSDFADTGLTMAQLTETMHAAQVAFARVRLLVASDNDHIVMLPIAKLYFQSLRKFGVDWESLWDIVGQVIEYF
jgi:hypothetical protein